MPSLKKNGDAFNMSKEYDLNLIIEDKIGNYDVKFYSADSNQFRMYGMWREGDRYARIPANIAKNISEGIGACYGTTSGGRIRFVTDSSFVAIKINYAELGHNDVTPSSATMAVNMYVDGEFGGVFRLPDGFCGTEYSGVQELKGEGEHLITLYMPTHSQILELLIGLEKNAKIIHAPDYKYEKPVVFYGSSITQGTGASRSGMTYVTQISRNLDTNYINLGFGGLAKGEPEMAEYISNLDMSVFVFDYDFNATTPQLEATHENFFKIIRAKQPNLPIIMISRPSSFRSGDEDTAKRFAIIKNTYDNAVSLGDKNVYLVNGLEFFNEHKWECMVDGVHPSDFGYHLMASKITPLIKSLLKG